MTTRSEASDGARDGANDSAIHDSAIHDSAIDDRAHDNANDSATHDTTTDTAATTSTPQRVWLSSRREVAPMVVALISRAQRMIRIADVDLSPFALAAMPVCEALARFLISHYQGRVRLLADSNSWNERHGARLQVLQRRFSHSLEVRIAAVDDPVGDDSYLLADDGDMLSLRPTARALGDLWRNNAPHAQPWAMAFERRWHAASHSLPATPLGL